jgi:hypothetical protein
MATEKNFNGTNPAAPSGARNSIWQLSGTPSGTDPATGQLVYPSSCYQTDMVGDTGSGGSDGLVPAPGAGTAAAGKFLKADGTWAVPPGGVTPGQIQQQAFTYAADTVAANACAVSLSPSPSLTAGSIVVFKATNANTGASTLAVNGGSAIAIKKQGTTALSAGDIAAGQIVAVGYDGTNFQLMGGAGGSTSGALIYTGAWSSGTAYAVANVVLYSGNLYMRLIAGGAGGSPSALQSKAAGGTGVSPIAFTSPVTAGNLLVVAIVQDGGTIAAPTDTIGTAYTLAASQTGANNLAIYYGIAPTSGANSVTAPNVAFSQTAICELANVNAVVNLTASAYNSSTPSSVSITTTVSGCYIFVAIGGFHNGNVYTALTGFTMVVQNNGSDAIGTAVGAASSAGAYTAGFNITSGGSDNVPVVAVAFETGVLTPDLDTANWIKM